MAPSSPSSTTSVWQRLLFACQQFLYRFGIGAAPAAAPTQTPASTLENKRMLALALQGQGQLDMAFERFRPLPLSAAVLDNLQHLALAFERQGQPSQAQEVYRHMGRVPTSPTQSTSNTGALTMLGHYQLGQPLGKGAMGVVYLGTDVANGRQVAIKTLALSREFSGHELEDVRARFFREAEAASRLQHPHIVAVFEAAEEGDVAFIAMEFLKGTDLLRFCKLPNLLPVPQVLSIASRVALALAYAHRQHVVHRDIKPANIMFDAARDTVKITDFGVARITDNSKTQTGLVLGTPSFMAPEQLAGQRVDGRCDLYSLGVMLFQLLTGVLPFRGHSLAEVMFKIANEEAPDIRSSRPALPPQLASVVARALHKRPEARYQDGDAFAHDLEGVLADVSGSINDAGAAPQTGAAQAAGALSRSYEKTVVLRASPSPTARTENLP